MNKVILKGRLTDNPKLKKTPSDVSVCDFTIAVNRRFAKDKTDFINCQAWRQGAEFIDKYFTKGKEIAIVGELNIESYDKDGEKRYFTRVVVEESFFCGNKSDSAESSKPITNDLDVAVVDDDLPF